MDVKDIKKYHRIRLWISLGEALFLIFIMIIIVQSGISHYLENFIYSISQNNIVAFLLFMLTFGIGSFIINFPVSYYLDYKLEKKYELSNQKFRNWLNDKMKAILVSALITTPILLVFYLVLLELGKLWWLAVGIFIFLFSIFLTRIAPTIIFPIFYKFMPIQSSDLKDDLIQLCRKYNFNVEGVFKFDMSKRTKRANAGLAGIGKSKRIILSDTLLENFNKGEIIAIFAHELGHYKLKHIVKVMIFGLITILSGLWLASIVYDYFIFRYGFKSISQLAALPILAIILYLYGFITLPINNMILRKYEYESDKFALSVTENKIDFINALKKLGEINLSDMNPNPIIEFLFYDHPSLSKRIALAERY